jgi:SAM-dependent methyltransferase
MSELKSEMSFTEAQACVAPFDTIADHYDHVFTTSIVGQAQRSSVWKELGRVFRAGDCVLEIGCGTGVDACFLAERGVRVVACDSSPRMIAVTTRRLKTNGLASLVRPTVLAAEAIASLPHAQWFDGAFSNFGAFNCLQEPRAVAEELGHLLKPGAKLLLCWMGPCCLWEMIWYLAQGKPSKAFRRFRHGGVSAQVANGPAMRVHYPSVRAIARTFAPEFRLTRLKGIGTLVPPSYVEASALRCPRLLKLGIKADKFLARCPGIRLLSDHVLLEFEREQL